MKNIVPNELQTLEWHEFEPLTPFPNFSKLVVARNNKNTNENVKFWKFFIKSIILNIRLTL